jgi:hydrogenase maturation protein HypF
MAAPEHAELAHHGWTRNLNSPQTSAVGRLFDAAAALTGLCQHASFEGQGPMMLESVAGVVAHDASPLPLVTGTDDLLCADWQPLLDGLTDDTVPVVQRASWFHGTLAATLRETALRLCERESIDCVGLNGGVFQNRLLTEAVVDMLSASGLRVLVPERLPCNDAGISFGQIVEFSAGPRR